MRSIEEQIKVIHRRSSLYRERKQIRMLSFAAAGIGALLTAVLMFAPEVKGTVGFFGTHLGATILGPEAGGYVITALLSFALGITVAIITQKYRKIDEGLYGRGKTGKERPTAEVTQKES